MGWPNSGSGGGGGGAALETLPVAHEVANMVSDKVALVIGGSPKIMPLAELIASLGVADTDLPAAAALASSDVLVINQGGVAVKTTLGALATFLGSTPGTAPAAVTSLAAGSPTTTTIPLTWVNASGATGWTVKQRLAGSGSYVDSTMSVAAGSTGGTVSGLTAGTAYDFQVTASNTNGAGPAATLLNVPTASVGTVAPTVPVTALAAPSKTDTAVTLTWTNAATATGWRVKQRLAGGGAYTDSTLSVAATATGCTVSGLTLSTSYDFEITAYNSGGDGPAATLLAVTTNGAGVAYTIVKYTTDPAVTIDGTTPTGTVSGTKYFNLAKTKAQYWTITPTPASCVGGWGTSSTVPPAEITAAQNNTTNKLNGLMPMTKPAAYWDCPHTLWVPVGSGTTVWYFWIKPVDGVAQCLNAAVGTTVTGA